MVPAHFLSTSSKSASTTPGSDEPPESPAPGGGASVGPPFPYISTPICCAAWFSASIAARSCEISSVVRTFRRASSFSSTALRDACGRRRDAGEVESTQAHVVPGHGAFALKHVDLDARLTVRRGREDFALPCGNRRVPLDQLREDAALRLDAQAQGGHIEQEDVLHLAAEDRGLDRRAERDALHRVDRPLCRPTEDLLESGLDGRHARRPSDQDDMIDVPVLPPAVFEGLANRGVEAIQRGLDQLLELRAGDLLLQVHRLPGLLGDERQVDRRS